MASHLSVDTRAATALKLRAAADLLDRGEDVEAGRILLAGVPAVIADVKANVGPLKWGIWVKLFIAPFLNSLLK